MFTPPSVSLIQEIAAKLGVCLEVADASIYREIAEEQLHAINAFLETTQFAEDFPLLDLAERNGRPPRADEDPYHAWLWKCDFGGHGKGLLSGQTVSFKDHISVAGIPQTFASSIMDGFVPTCDATVVSRVLQAGGRVIGKNAMSGFIGDMKTPINPHHPAHTTGGSSSGSAAAIAAREVDISFGGDQGGSIRVPAAYCGVAGLKPTFGLISHFGIGFVSEPSLDHVGPMASTVENIARALDSTAGFVGLDPRQGRDIPEKVDTLATLENGVAGMRIGVLLEGFDEPINPLVRDGVLKAIQALRDAGARVREVSIPEHRQIDKIFTPLAVEGSRATVDAGIYGMGFKTLYPTSAIAVVEELWRDHLGIFPYRTIFNQMLGALSRQVFRGAAYAKAHNVRPAIVRAYDEALTEVDILALPTVRDIAPMIEAPPSDHLDAIRHDIRKENWILSSEFFNTKPANYTGHPALAIPCGKVNGLPISLQFIGRHFDEALLLRAAYTLEASIDFTYITTPGA